jgi:hypothetical protein
LGAVKKPDSKAAMGTLLSFLGTAAESYEHGMRTGVEGSNSEQFDTKVNEWAYGCSDELALIGLELEGNGVER